MCVCVCVGGCGYLLWKNFLLNFRHVISNNDALFDLTRKIFKIRISEY